MPKGCTVLRKGGWYFLRDLFVYCYFILFMYKVLCLPVSIACLVLVDTKIGHQIPWNCVNHCVGARN